MKRYLAPLVLSTLLFAACGGDGDGDLIKQSAGGDVGSATTAASGATSSTTTKAGGNSTTTVSGAGLLFGGKCADAARAYLAGLGSAAAAMSGGGKEAEASIAQLQAFTDQAPAEIRNDFKVVATGLGLFIKAIKDAGINLSGGLPSDPRAITALSNAAKELDKPEFKAASDKVNAWFQTNCK